MPHEKILILGGTAEAADLAARLVAQGGVDVITSLAGRTREPAPLAGTVRIGGFGGVPGLVAYLAQHGITRVIDATHPYARQISANAAKACAAAGVPLETLKRHPWSLVDGDLWTLLSSETEAADTLPAGGRFFLALGRQYLGVFAKRSDCFFIIRMIDRPEQPLPISHYELVLGRPSPDVAEEIALLRHHGVTHLVCRNSGGAAGYAKIAAARQLELPVLMIGRPD